MKRLILLLLFCVSVNAQSITISGTTYELIGNEIKSDPNTFLHQFIEDALERGFDFTGVRGVFTFTEGTGSTKGYSVRTDACQGRYRIGLQRYFWNNYDWRAGLLSGATNLYEQRRHLVYHELGHALLKLQHVCHGESREIAPDLVVLYPIYDIMFSARSCAGRYAFESYPYRWNRHLNRMFDSEFQSTYSCGSNKSSNPIIDY